MSGLSLSETGRILDETWGVTASGRAYGGGGVYGNCGLCYERAIQPWIKLCCRKVFCSEHLADVSFLPCQNPKPSPSSWSPSAPTFLYCCHRLVFLTLLVSPCRFFSLFFRLLTSFDPPSSSGSTRPHRPNDAPPSAHSHLSLPHPHLHSPRALHSHLTCPTVGDGSHPTRRTTSTNSNAGILAAQEAERRARSCTHLH
jgi:hypothetical protein